MLDQSWLVGTIYATLVLAVLVLEVIGLLEHGPRFMESTLVVHANTTWSLMH